MLIERARKVTGDYPDLRNKNLCRGERGNVRPAEIVDVTDAMPDRPDALWRKRRGSPRILAVYAKDLGDNWYVQLALAFPGSGFNPVGFAPVSKLKWDERGLELIEQQTGLTADELRALYRACAPDHVRTQFPPTDAAAA